MLYTKLELIQAAKWSTEYVNSLPNSAFLVIEGDYLSGKTDDKRARHLPVKDKGGKLDLAHYNNAGSRLNQVQPVSGPESAEELRAKARKAWEALEDQVEKLRKRQRLGSEEPTSTPADRRPEPHRGGPVGSGTGDPQRGGRTMDELEKARAENAALQKQVGELTQKLEDLEQADHAKILAERDTRIRELEEQAQTLETARADLEQAKTDLESKVETMEATNQELAKKVEDLSKKVEEMSAAEAAKKIEARKAQIEAMEKLSTEYKEKCLAKAEGATDEDWEFVVESARMANGTPSDPEGGVIEASAEAGATPAGKAADGQPTKSKQGKFLQEHLAKPAKEPAK